RFTGPCLHVPAPYPAARSVDEPTRALARRNARTDHVLADEPMVGGAAFAGPSSGSPGLCTCAGAPPRSTAPRRTTGTAARWSAGAANGVSIDDEPRGSARQHRQYPDDVIAELRHVAGQKGLRRIIGDLAVAREGLGGVLDVRLGCG